MNKYLSIIFCLFSIILAFCLAYINFGGTSVDVFFSEPLYGYSFLLFLLSLIFVFIFVHKTNTIYLPSLIVLILFIIGPWIGYSNYQAYIDVHGDFYGTRVTSFAYPTFIWSVGTASFFAGVLISHTFIQWPKYNYVILWNFKALSFFIWITLGLSFIFSVVAIVRIGYIPLLTMNILDERVHYLSIVGRYTHKFSRFWVFAASLSSSAYFLSGHRKLYLYLTFLCALGMLLYGQRTGTFIVLVTFGLMYFKFHKPKIAHVLVVGLLTLILAYAMLFYASKIRTGWDFRGKSLGEILTVRVFSEWNHYVSVMDETRKSDYLGKKLFLGPLATLIPRQFFMPFGLDKDKIIKKYSAVYIYGEKFNQPYGIRVTPIGEGYAGYGIAGVILILFFLGVYSGALEKIYLRLNKQDARLSPISLFLANCVFVPLLSVYNVLVVIFLPLLCFAIFLLIGTTRSREGS